MLTIEEIKRAVTPICERYGVERLSLFGSYARGEADEKSDVDLIHDGGKFKGWEYGGFYRLDYSPAICSGDISCIA